MLNTLIRGKSILGVGSLVLITLLFFNRASASPTLVQTASMQPAVLGEPDAGSSVISYQGRLLDPTTGQPKPDGAYTMVFNLYNFETGGVALWTETKNVASNKGLFTTLLGDTTFFPAGTFTGQELYLGIAVGGDPETTPRQRVASVAYAVWSSTAAWAETLDGLDSTAFAPVTHAHSGADITNGTLTASKLAVGVVPKFISLDPGAAYLEGSGAFYSDGFGPNAGIHLRDVAANLDSFQTGFTIPPNYSAGTPLVLRLVWHTSGINCKIDFRGNAISVSRPGRNHIVGAITDDGITIVGGELLLAPNIANQSNETFVNITSPDGTTRLLPGDSIHVGLYRRSDSPGDSCTSDMVIQGISVTYQ